MIIPSLIRSGLLRLGTLAALAAAGAPAQASPAAPNALLEAKVPEAPRPAPTYQPAKGMFLVASRQLADPNFARTVVLLLEYDRSGALGLIINRPTRLVLAHLLPEVEELGSRMDVVYEGGPVARQQVLLLLRSHVPPPDGSRVFADTYLSASLVTLRALAAGDLSADTFHAFVGYAGWAPGQLDTEVARGDWHVVPAAERDVFDGEASDVWPRLIEQSSGRWVRTAPAIRHLASDRP